MAKYFETSIILRLSRPVNIKTAWIRKPKKEKISITVSHKTLEINIHVSFRSLYSLSNCVNEGYATTPTFPHHPHHFFLGGGGEEK